jgi:hypothetical protein
MRRTPSSPTGLCITLILLSISLTGIVWLASAQVHASPPPAAGATTGEALPTAGRGGSPVMFVENVGQFAGDARFQVHGGPGAAAWLADDAIWLTVVEAADAEGSSFDAEGVRRPPGNEPRQGMNVKLSFAGANARPRLEPFDRLDTAVSYLIGNDPQEWHTAVPAWGGVRYVDLYPGIDLELASEGGQVVPRLVARSGTDLSTVRLRVEGADAVAVEGDALRLSTASGEVSWPLLRADSSPGEATVQPLGPGLFQITAPFCLPSGARHLSLTEDNPADLRYGAYLGGSKTDWGSSIAVDGSGAAYVAGYTSSPDFPTTPGAFDPSYNGDDDNAFVAKVGPDGSALEYATFLGGTGGWAFAEGIAVDGSGAAYVAGYTSASDFPTTPGALDTSHNGLSDAFVVKLDPAGSALAYSTFLGGTDYDSVTAIAVDESGQVYVAGQTSSADLPTTAGAFDTSHNGLGDGFVAKLSADGSALDYSTFLGGSQADGLAGIAVDGSGAAYVTGGTNSSDLPITAGAYDTSYNGLGDVFVVKLAADASALEYATFLGGTDQEWALFSEGGISVDGAGAAYVTGYTFSSDFPTTPGALDTACDTDGTCSNGDAFVVKLSTDGSALDYATFLGGEGCDEGYGIDVDDNGAAYVTGWTDAPDFPITPGAYDTSHNGVDDVFVVKLSADGSALEYGTFLGGSEWEDGCEIDVDGNGAAYVTGWTDSPDLPTTPGAFDTVYGGSLGEDAFVVKLAMGGGATYSISGRVSDDNGQGVPNVTISAGAGGSAVTDANGDYVITHVTTGTYTLTPSMSDYSFVPNARRITVPPDATRQDFLGLPATFAISGRVVDSSGEGIPWVVVLAGEDGLEFTDDNGDYAFTGLITGTYTITPNRSDYIFSPLTLTVIVPPDAPGQVFTGTYTAPELAKVLTDFVAAGREEIGAVSDAAVDVAEAGDYYLDRIDTYLARQVIKLGLNSLPLYGLGMGELISKALGRIATPGFQAAFDSAWPFWEDPRVVNHFSWTVYEAIRTNNAEYISNSAFWSGLWYYAKQAGFEATETEIRDWLLDEFLPGSSTPVADSYGNQAQELGEGYQADLQRELEALLADLPELGLTPEEEVMYEQDLMARSHANRMIGHQLVDYRDMLWDNYENAKVDEAKWLKFSITFLVKTTVISAASMGGGYLGYYAATKLCQTYDLIHDFYEELRALEQHQRSLDQAKRFLEESVSMAYRQISDNTVQAMNLIRSHGVPQIGDGTLGVLTQKSFGHYRVFGGLSWVEDRSEVGVPISNTTEFTVTYQTSVAYAQAEIWSGYQRMVALAEAPELPPGSWHTALVRLKTKKNGISPDDGSRVELDVLAFTDTGVYPLNGATLYWDPVRYETESRALARVPAGYSDAEAANAPTVPFPLSSAVGTLPGSTNHIVSIIVQNPFTFTVSAALTQSVPTEFSIIDAGGAQLVADDLVWTEVLTPHVGVEWRAVLGWEGEPGASTVLPAPVLTFDDPVTGQSDTYTGEQQEVAAPWPLEVTAEYPLTWTLGVTTPITVTLQSISPAVTADGELQVTIREFGGAQLWSAILPVHVAPGQSQVLAMEAEISTAEPFAALSGEIVLGPVQRRAFLQPLSVIGSRLYLPLVTRQP